MRDFQFNIMAFSTELLQFYEVDFMHVVSSVYDPLDTIRNIPLPRLVQVLVFLSYTQ
jgi:hypothetical protein